MEKAKFINLITNYDEDNNREDIIEVDVEYSKNFLYSHYYIPF